MSEERSQLRKTIRLPADAYRKPGSTWLVTITTANRQPFFSDDPSFAGATLAMFTNETPRRGLDLHLSCLMPDHVHLLASVSTGDLLSAVAALKSLSNKVFYGFGYSGQLWHRSFHDQGIRGEKAFDEAARYVLHNPVAAGLVAAWEEYDLIDGTWLGRL